MNITADIVIPCLCSFIACAALGIQFNIKPGHLIAASVGSIVSQLVLTLVSITDIGDVKSCFIAAAAVALYSEIMARIFKAPVNMYLIIGIIPLVPGGLIYYTMLALVMNDTDTFLDRCVDAFSQAGAIAMGIFVVSSAVKLSADIIRFLKKKYTPALKEIASKSNGGVKKL